MLCIAAAEDRAQLSPASGGGIPRRGRGRCTNHRLAQGKLLHTPKQASLMLMRLMTLSAVVQMQPISAMVVKCLLASHHWGLPAELDPLVLNIWHHSE